MKVKFSTVAAACALTLTCAAPAFPRPLVRGNPTNALKTLYTPDYLARKSALLAQLKDLKPGRFKEWTSGLKRDVAPERKVIALTFDACGGRKSGYNAELIEYLRRERIRATLFVTGIWIERNKAAFMELAKDPLFEIGNHGLLHRACSVSGRTKYGVIHTASMGDVIDEMELNARKIQELTGRRPVFFRSATAYTDEASVRIAGFLGMEMVGYDILSGDAMGASSKTMARNIMNGAKHGAVVIMHFHRPEWGEAAALKEVVPVLRSRGYTFDKLKNFPLKPVSGAEPARRRTSGRLPQITH